MGSLVKCVIIQSGESPKGVYGPVEDLHLIFNHLISLWLQSNEK